MNAGSPNIRGMTVAEIRDTLDRRGFLEDAAMLPVQLCHGIQRDSLARFADIPLLARHKVVRAEAALSDASVELVSRHPSWDRTVRYLFRAADGAVFEAVLLHHHGLWTACISSQAGCPLACRFCATGMLGLTRDLLAWEIVDQVLQIQRSACVRISDLVFMGMGEPLLNEANVYQAATVLSQNHGCQISVRRIVISTSGVVPAIHRFIDDARPFKLVFSPLQLRLTVSVLHQRR